MTWLGSRNGSAGQMRQFMKNGRNRWSFLGGAGLCFAAMFTAGQGVPTRSEAELKLLQGYWEGEGAGGKCSITISGHSLVYRAGTDWFKTTFTLTEGTNPRQLHATITDSSPPTNSIDTVVSAIFKIEHGTLTLATFDRSTKPSAETFENESSRYVVKKAP